MGKTRRVLLNYAMSRLVFFLIGLSVTLGQVTISPTSLFLDSKKRFETIIIQNSSAVAQEVQMKWQFGYPIADEAGTISMVYEDSLLEAKYSVADWVRGFPKNFILEPGARQTVRVTIKAPRDLPDGTFWTRLFTTSSAVSPPIGSDQPGGISAEINIKFNQITTVFYKHGNVTTGLVLKEISGVLNGQDLTVLAAYTKSGNSPYLGTMQVNIYDVLGELVKQKLTFVSLYFDGARRLKLDVTDLPMGSYDVEVSFISHRADIPDANVIQVEPVLGRSTFTKL